MAFDQAVFQHIVETIKEGLVVVDRANRIVFANPAASACLGQPVESLLQTRCPVPFSVQRTLEHELVCPNGTTAVLEIKTTAIDWHKESAHLLTLSNITEHRRIVEFTRHVTLLGDITRAAIGNLSQQELFQMLADRLGELHRADGCFLTLWDEVQQTAVLGASYGPLKDLYPQLFANNGLMRLLGEGQAPIAIQDIRHSRYFSKKRIQRLPFHSLLILPLERHAQHVGAVVLLFVRAMQFGDEILARMQQAAEQATLVLTKDRLLAETQERSRDLERLAAVSAEIRASRRVADMLPHILQTADLAQEAIGCIFLLAPEQNSLLVAGIYPQHGESLPPSFPQTGILNHVFTTQRPYLTQRLQDDPLATDSLATVALFRTARSNVFLPLLAEGMEMMGVLYVGLLRERDFSDREIGLLTAVTEIAVSAFQRTLLLQTLEERVQERTQALADANQKLRQLDRLRAKFVTDMSHELRTPVTTFQLYLDLIERAPLTKRERYFTVLRTQTNRLAHLIEKALTLSRVDIIADALTLEPVDFNKVVETAVSTYRPSAEEKQLSLHFTPQPAIPLLLGSQAHLQMAVSEILDNAIQYNRPSGSIWVNLHLDKSGEQVVLRVEDVGFGVAEQELPHLFERFYRGENVAQLNVPGTGLGLAIVQEIVHLHGGEATVRAREDGGTAVSIILPLAH